MLLTSLDDVGYVKTASGKLCMNYQEKKPTGMSIIDYYRRARTTTLVLLVITAWLTVQKHIPWVAGWILTTLDSLFLVMTDIKIKEYEDNL